MEEIEGYGFHPTDEQLVGHFLRKKRLDPDYSHPKIREIKINDYEPSELPGLALESDASYFFVAPRYTNTKRNLVKRKTRGGTWKVTGKIADVKDKRSKEVIGSKRKLVFYEDPSTRNKNVRTNYVMDELHCKPDSLFKADFVVVRIKIKPKRSRDSSTTSESVIIHHLTSDSRDLIAEVSQVETQQVPDNYMSCNSEDYSADITFSKIWAITEDLVTTNTSTEVEPLVPAVWDSLIDYNGLDRNSFYTQQTQVHLQQQVEPLVPAVWDSLIDYNGLDRNSFYTQQTQVHLQQQVEPLVPAVWDSLIDYNGLDRNSFYTQQTQVHLQQQVWDSLIDYNVLDQNSFPAQQTQIHLQQGSSHSCDFSSDSNVLHMGNATLHMGNTIQR